MENRSSLKPGTKFALGIQHLFAMFGATVLVPILTGLNASVALISAGLGTLLFHFITGHKVPVFLGSSFAFIGAVRIFTVDSSTGAFYAPNELANIIPKVQSGIIAAGLVYVVLSLLIRLVGIDKIKNFFPPVVTGPVIVCIGLGLTPVALQNAGLIAPSGAGADWKISWGIVGVAALVLAVIIATSIFAKGFFKLVPILIGISFGYILCIILDVTTGTNFISFSKIADASWVNIPYVTKGFFTLPAFDLGAIVSIAPIALVTFMEHIGDITTNGAVIGKDLIKDPGLSKTVLGDGLATSLAGFFGGPANTTYSENTGVLATTKVYDTSVLKIAAIAAVILGFFGKFGAILQTIPAPVMGGVSIMLYGMIASIGIRTLSEAQLDFTHSRNLIIVALILVFGLGLWNGIPLTIGGITLNISGLFIAVIIGVLVNKILPKEE